MKRVRRLIVSLAAAVFLAWLFFPQRPSEKLPPSAKNVKFAKNSFWQYWEYNLRFDADPEVCRSFAIDLIVKHGCSTSQIIVEATQGHAFIGPAPRWMEANQVTNGILLSGLGGWITAVVDKDRGRLYYRAGGY